ncbi:hypothetical protein BTVI_94308 [Pitangus sulphuratus]|nr:hypothetical protein BTVI_94308 [Pitangus sulphuratus]
MHVFGMRPSGKKNQKDDNVLRAFQRDLECLGNLECLLPHQDRNERQTCRQQHLDETGFRPFSRKEISISDEVFLDQPEEKVEGEVSGLLA